MRMTGRQTDWLTEEKRQRRTFVGRCEQQQERGEEGEEEQEDEEEELEAVGNETDTEVERLSEWVLPK